MSDHDDLFQKLVYVYDMNSIGVKIPYTHSIKMSNYKESDIPLLIQRCSKVGLHIAYTEYLKTNSTATEKQFLEHIRSFDGIKIYNDSINKCYDILDPELSREKLALFLKQNRTT